MISAIVLSRNNDELIRGCLESLKWVDEIIVVLDEGPGKSLEIAKEYTDKIVRNKEEDFSNRRNLGMEKAKG
jgi:glycosyltransferase involved in cell wall biosynthesis